MNRSFYLDLAREGLRMPIGTDMVLHEKADLEARLLDGRALGEVVVEAAHRYRTPLAFPLMDLRVEKQDLLLMLGVPDADIDTYHFHAIPGGALDTVKSKMSAAPTPRMRANLDSIRHVAAQGGGMVPVGMAIGPFSLMTKLLADPIMGVYLAGDDPATADPEAKLVLDTLEIATLIVQRAITTQVQAGAKAVCLCEPAANKVYISPMQMDAGSDVFDRLVMRPNRRVKQTIADLGADLIFHDCGELTEPMLRAFNELDPAVLSLGSSRTLWDDAPLIKPDTVLFGNLPSKKFYSDQEITVAQVKDRSRELVQAMRRKGHPFILGSECDVLSVPGAHDTIAAKVEAMLTCGA